MIFHLFLSIQKHLLYEMILACHHLVDLIHSVEWSAKLVFVLVFQTMLDAHQIADPSALRIPSVRIIWPVLMKNVVTHVQDLAERMLLAQLSIILPLVFVIPNTRVIPSLVVQ
jgi:hypothetical protein